MKERLKEFDMIRGIAALSVIFIHVSGLTLSSRNVKISNPVFLLNQAVRFSVPIFLIISGYVLHYSYANAKTFSLMSFVRRRFVRILIPYVIWTLIYILYALRNDLGLILSDKKGFVIFLGQQLISGTAALHLYFILIIIQMYFLYPLLRKLVLKWPEGFLCISFVLSMLFQCIVFAKLINHNFPAELDFKYQLLFPTWTFYFVFGMYLAGGTGFLENRLPAKRLILSAWCLSMAFVIFNSLLTETYFSSVKPDIMIYSIISFILLYSVLQTGRNFRSLPARFMLWFSQQSYGIYLSHILFLNLIIIGMGSAYKGFFSDNLLGILSVLTAATVITSAFAFGISRTPFALFFGCVRHKKAD